MVAVHTNTCDRCKRANPIDYRVEPEEARKLVVLNRWKKLCPLRLTSSRRLRVKYRFADVEATSWSDRPAPAKRYGQRR